MTTAITGVHPSSEPIRRPVCEDGDMGHSQPVKISQWWVANRLIEDWKRTQRQYMATVSEDAETRIVDGRAIAWHPKLGALHSFYLEDAK